VALDCAKRGNMMPPVAGLHIVELAEVNPRFSGFLSKRGQ
jgi:hypothetical protein